MKNIILTFFLFTLIIIFNNSNVNASIIEKKYNNLNLTSDYFDSKVQLNITKVKKSKSSLTIYCELINNTNKIITLKEDDFYLLNIDKLDINVNLRKTPFLTFINISPDKSKSFKITVDNTNFTQGTYTLKGKLNTYDNFICNILDLKNTAFENVTIRIPI